MFEELKEMELLEIDGGCECCRNVARMLPWMCNQDFAYAMKGD